MKRNLLFYVYPRHCAMLDLNLHRLGKFLHTFNGRKIFLTAVDEHSLDVERFRWRLVSHGIYSPQLEIIERKNNPVLWDSAYFFELLSMVESQNPNEISFFCHSKGCSQDVFNKRKTTIQEISTWVDLMYEANLANIFEVENVMASHPCAGILKQNQEIFEMNCPWYYAGTFYWFNHQKLFTPGWRHSNITRFTGEEYPGNRFRWEEAYCWRNLENKVNLYKKESYDSFAPIINNFDASRVSLISTCMNRIEFLKQTLPTWCGHNFKEIIIVDWSSDEPIHRYLRGLRYLSNEPLKVVRVDNQTIFNAGQARNTGARVATGDFLLFIDADIRIRNWDATKWMTLGRGRFLHGMDDHPPFGTFLVHRDDFETVNGHAENMLSYGYEDNDIFNRLQASGSKLWYYDDSFVEHIEHSDALRAAHRDQQGLSLQATVKANKQLAMTQPWTKECKRAELPISYQ